MNYPTNPPRIECTREESHTAPRNCPRFFVSFRKAIWDGVLMAAVADHKPMDAILREAVREYLERRELVEPRDRALAKLNTRCAISVASRDGEIQRTFEAWVKNWEFNGLCAVAEHDGDPIGRTLAHAVRLYVVKRGIEPPPRDLEAVKRVCTARNVTQGEAPPRPAET